MIKMGLIIDVNLSALDLHTRQAVLSNKLLLNSYALRTATEKEKPALLQEKSQLEKELGDVNAQICNLETGILPEGTGNNLDINA